MSPMPPPPPPRSRPHLAAAMLALALAGAGCVLRGKPGAGADLTGGRTIEIYVVDQDSAYARYRVERDGVLRFGGGMDAQQERYSWSGPLERGELDRLLELATGDRWFQADPPSSYEPADRSYTIRLSGPAGRRAFTVIGDEPSVAEAAGILATAARRRHERFLRTLPRPGRQKP